MAQTVWRCVDVDDESKTRRIVARVELAEYIRAARQWEREGQGVYFERSDDGGKTWRRMETS